jgi:hypothetical protein
VKARKLVRPAATTMKFSSTQRRKGASDVH